MNIILIILVILLLGSGGIGIDGGNTGLGYRAGGLGLIVLVVPVVLPLRAT